MKKKAIVLLAFTAALTAVSCQKEAVKEAETTPMGEGMTISAVSEGIGAETKVEMAYKYDLLWQKDDEILVKKGTTEAIFKLQSGEKTTTGTFTCQSSPFQAGDEVDAYYPKSIVSEGNPVWPATMTDNQTVPMYCKKTLSSTENQTFNFASLGSVLQLTFSTTSSDIVLKSIEVKADEAMSGAFTIENGQAKVSQPEGDKPGITLDLGEEGVKVGVTAKKFNIAVPAGEYNNLTITFIAKDGQKCIIHATKPQSIEYNTVNTLAISGEFKYYVESISLDKSAVELKAGDNITLVATVLPDNATDKSISWSSDKADIAAVDETGKVTAIAVGTATITATTTDGGKTATCAVTVKKGLPDGALPGVFSVSDTKKVYFSQGNLWYGKVGDAQTTTFNFEANQYSSASSWKASHVSHFFWSKTESVAYAASYSDAGAATGDVFFTNETVTTAKAGFTVNVGGKEQSGWHTLSTEEWQYLFNTRTMEKGGARSENLTSSGITVEDVLFKGVVLFPDNFTNQADWKTKYTTWKALNDAGIVFLPAAGRRTSSSVTVVGDYGNYWSSTAKNYNGACRVNFGSDSVSPDGNTARQNGYSVRLVTESN